MKKKVIKVIGIIFAIILYIIITNAIIIGYIMYQESSVNNNLEKYNNLIANIIVKENINITHKPANEYISFNGLKIRNDFKNFTKKMEEDTTYVTYKFEDIPNKRLVYFEIDVYDETINASYSSDFIEKYNIKNDVDYINALKNYSFEETKYNYEKILENDDAVTGAEYFSDEETYYNIIEGDYIGLIINEKYSMAKIVYLYKNNKTYVLRFEGFGYFTDEQIYDLISTVIIN